MSALWQISFTVSDQADAFAEMVEAAAETEAVTLHRARDEDPWMICIISTEAPERERVQAALDAAAAITGQAASALEIARLPARDWLSENRKSFPPLDIGCFWIYGSHITVPVPDGKIGICLDAGQAFGSGTHGTTHGCITMLEKHLPAGNAPRIADIGCGSGILAVAAAKLRPGATVIAVDNDPVAVKVAAQNARDNAVDGVITAGVSDGYRDDLVQGAGPYDMILANILPGPLVEMAADAAACLAADGVLILSGLLEDQAEEVIKAHAGHGLELKDEVIFHGWSALVMEHGRNAR
ncbi:50S ribosomal protein L11 methyltransferase [Alphaproteobacteria bacterium LSUCC0684]